MPLSLEKISLTTLFLFSILLGFFFLAERKEEQWPLVVSFLDVGQGDAILINYQNKYQILIDGGPDERKLMRELAKTMPLGDHQIEIIISTHPDRDHFVGLLAVAKKYHSQAFFYNGQRTNDELWQELRQVLERQRVSQYILLEGSSLKIGQDFLLNFFNPDKVDKGLQAKNKNSIVARLDYKQNSFLFTGDADYDAEADMIFDKENIDDIDWLKVGHHGSQTSTSDFFLARVKAKNAIISVGKNSYGHPNSEVLEKLTKTGARIFRTDKMGTVSIFCRQKCFATK